MPSIAALPTRHLIGLILLAFWLGWTAVVLAAMATPARGDEAALRRVVASVQPLLPDAAGHTPQLIRWEPSPDCACPDTPEAEAAWVAARAAVLAAGGTATRLAAPAGAVGEVLLLDGEGQPRYSGPLQPRGDLCGNRPDALALWLPALLAGTTPALLLPPDCAC